MNEQTLDCELQLFGPIMGRTVRIPAEAKTITDKLLCEAQAAAMLGRETEFNEYVAVPGIHAVLLDYGQRKVSLPFASDMVILGVAEVMCTNNPQYRDLLSGIVNASRVIRDRYEIRDKV